MTLAKLSDIVQKGTLKKRRAILADGRYLCGDVAAYDQVTKRLTTENVARTFGAQVDQIKRFEIADLNVVKFSLPRPEIQGSLKDRDTHGASWAALLSEVAL